MKTQKYKIMWLIVPTFCSLTACTTPSTGDILTGSNTQLQTRSIQTRVFDMSDKQIVLRAVIATLQDIGFMVEQADVIVGSVSARKFVIQRGEGSTIRMTVTVRPRDSKQMLVRANAEFNDKTVEDPQAYQNFFTALGKTLFLSAQHID